MPHGSSPVTEHAPPFEILPTAGPSCTIVIPIPDKIALIFSLKLLTAAKSKLHGRSFD
jgi:hypothetical protein